MTLKGALHILTFFTIFLFSWVFLFQLKEILILFLKAKVGLIYCLHDSSSNIYKSFLSSRRSMLILFFLTSIPILLPPISRFPLYSMTLATHLSLSSNVIFCLGPNYYDGMGLVLCLINSRDRI